MTSSNAPRFGPNCIHYAGGACAAGVVVERMRDEHHRIPCVAVRGVRGAVSCDEMTLQAVPPPPEEGEMAKLLAAMLEGKCPTCGVAMTGEYEVGGGTYAAPCQHLLRQIPKPAEPVIRRKKEPAPLPEPKTTKTKPTPTNARHLKLVD